LKEINATESKDDVREGKPFVISKWLVMRAFEWVKVSAGVDTQSLLDFKRNLTDNLYKLWHRLL
jgi:hypothetical protein